jgi:hypothetical protein
MRERLASVGVVRLAVSILALIPFGAWVLLLLVAVLRPCSDSLCLQGFAWVVPVAALSLAGVVWLYAARRTAAPLYLVAGYLGAGALATVVVNPGYRLDPFVLASTLLLLVAAAALVDLRRQARSAAFTGVALLALGAWTALTRRDLTIDAVAPIVAGVLPLAAWRLSRAPSPGGDGAPDATGPVA